MATSAWKICLMNLFLEECTSWMMSPCRVSRFFSRKPGQHHRVVTHCNSSGLPATRLTHFPKPPCLVHKDPQNPPSSTTSTLQWGTLGPREDSCLPKVTEKARGRARARTVSPATRWPPLPGLGNEKGGCLSPREGVGLPFPLNHPNV